MYFLTIFALIQSVSAQSLDIAARLSPWPPPGWPAGAQGEVRLIVDAVEDGDLGLNFPVDDTGVVTYRLPETLPESADRFYKPMDLNRMAICDGAYPIVSPPDIGVVTLGFRIYADNEPWGTVEMSNVRQPGAFSLDIHVFFGLLYAQAPFSIGGSGFCDREQPVDVRYDLDLQAGRNLVVFEVANSLSGADALLTTAETLDLPATPQPLGE